MAKAAITIWVTTIVTIIGQDVAARRHRIERATQQECQARRVDDEGR
jgi:hypothetical protein